jgi:predicted nucleic acid-binding protein
VIHLDTSFLIDLQREARSRPGAAHAFLEQHAAEALAVSVHVLCELVAGIQIARHPERERARIRTLLADIAVAYPDERFAEAYGRVFAALERRGRRVPAMALLIGVTALLARAALVTRNPNDFAPVPDLEVLGY